MKMMSKFAGIIMAAAFSTVMISCVRPYDKPSFKDIESNETAFLIPLFPDEGTQTSDQVKIDSEAFYEQNQVSQKKIQIPHKWIQTGRFVRNGYYTDTVKVITVSRTPISGTWDYDSTEAVKLETKENSGFRIPMAYTIRIKSEDCAKYLYNYSPERSLQDVINSDVNKWIIGKMNERFHSLSYSEVSENKDPIIAQTVEEAKTYFAQKGITIEQLSAYDGIYWDDQTIENAISREVAAKADQRAKEEELKVVQKQKLVDEEKARAEASVAQIKANSLIAQKAAAEVKLKEQEVENSRIIAQAQAEAIKIQAAKGAPGANATTFVITANELESLGLGDLMKR